MIKKDNPAGRLYEFLSDARARPGNEKTVNVWNRVLQVDPPSHQILLRRYSLLLDLCEDARKRIKNSPNLNHDLYLENLPQIEKALDPIWLNQQWENPKQLLSDAVMTSLGFCAEELSKQRTEPLVEEAALADAQAEIEQLIADLLGASLPSELQAFIFGALEGARTAVIEYRLRGADGLRWAVDAAVAGAIRRRDEFKTNRGSDLLRRFWGAIRRIDALSSTALRLKELAAPLTDYIDR